MTVGKINELGDLYAEVSPEGTEISIRTAEVMYKNIPIGDQARKEAYINCEGKDYQAVLEFVGGEAGHVEVRIHELLEQNGRVGVNNNVYKILPMGAPAPGAVTNQAPAQAAPTAPAAPGLNVNALMAKAGTVPAVAPQAPATVPAVAPQAPIPTAPEPPATVAPAEKPLTKREAREKELEAKYSKDVRIFAKHISKEQAEELVKTSNDTAFMLQVVAFMEDMVEVDPDKIDRMARILRTLPASLAKIYEPEHVARHILAAWEV